MNHTNRIRALALATALIASLPALAQQKTGPGISGEDSLTWHGITLYGVVDVGVQYDSHSAPFTPYRPAASGNIVRQNDSQSVTGVTPSNMGQSRVGLQGTEPLGDDWSAIFQVETFFNPQSGELADSLKSLTANNGVALANQTVGVDGSSAGQVFQTAWIGVSSKRFGSLTFGRQVTPLLEGVIKYDPNYNATAFGLLGASNTFSGAGSQEENRVNDAVKYEVRFNDQLHAGALFKANTAGQTNNSLFQVNVGASLGGLSVDAYYSQANNAIVATSLSATQVTGLAKLGYSVDSSVAATVSDNTATALMASYRLDPFKVFAGFEQIRYTNPTHPLTAGYGDIGGYVLAYVTSNAYNQAKVLNLYWTGVRYTVVPNLDLTAAWYRYDQNAYGTGTAAGCTTSAHSSCFGSLEAESFDADYRFTRHLDAYIGAMYSVVHDGLASGYLHTTNINPTIGARYKF